jgi:hypothetical protein
MAKNLCQNNCLSKETPNSYVTILFLQAKIKQKNNGISARIPEGSLPVASAPPAMHTTRIIKKNKTSPMVIEVGYTRVWKQLTIIQRNL